MRVVRSLPRIKQWRLSNATAASSELSASSVHYPSSSSAVGELSADSIAEFILKSEWSHLDSFLPSLSPPLISSILVHLQGSPHLIPSIVHCLGHRCLDLQSLSTVAVLLSADPTLSLLKQSLTSGLPKASPREVFDALAVAHNQCRPCDPPIAFDLLLCAYAESGDHDGALEFFYLMKEENMLPKIESCNSLLSVFLKKKQMEKAWVLYAEMFRLRISSTIVTYTIKL